MDRKVSGMAFLFEYLNADEEKFFARLKKLSDIIAVLTRLIFLVIVISFLRSRIKDGDDLSVLYVFGVYVLQIFQAALMLFLGFYMGKVLTTVADRVFEYFKIKKRRLMFPVVVIAIMIVILLSGAVIASVSRFAEFQFDKLTVQTKTAHD